MHSLQGEALPDWENSTNRVTMNFQECLRNFAGTVSTLDLEEESMKKKATVKLALNRETLRDLVSSRSTAVNDPGDSCAKSCYFNSCGNTCEPPLTSLQGTAVQ